MNTTSPHRLQTQHPSAPRVMGKLTMLLVVLPFCAWALYGVFGDQFASAASAKFGAKLLARGDGIFADAGAFIKGIFKDATVLLTASCLLLLAYRLASIVAEGRLRAPASWVVKGWSLFVCLNVFVAVAMHTALFWCLLYAGKDDIDNFTHWHIKEALIDEATAPSLAILLGNSQTHRQIDAKILNQRLAGKIWTTQLHFPESSVYDSLLALERIPSSRVKYIISYLSEPPFYSDKSDRRLMFYFGLRDLPAYWKLGSGRPDFDRFLIGGLLADIFPIYRTWEPLMARLHGVSAQKKEQARYDALLEPNLEVRARRIANDYKGRDSLFQKRAFVMLAQKCRERGSRLVICAGQCNPILERALNPSIRRDMMDFLHQQAAKDPNIILLDEPQMPRQIESDYEDLAHVNTAAGERFSQYLANVLEQFARTNVVGITAYPNPR